MDTPPTLSSTITYDDFAKLEFRVATVLECKPHPNADKLLVLQVDLGVSGGRFARGFGSMWRTRNRWSGGS